MASMSCSDQPEAELQVQAVAIENPHSNYQQPDYDFVDQPDQDYFCPVSLELLTQPHQTICCGNHISQQAADRLIRDKKPCPMCKKDNFATHEDLYFKRNGVNKLKVYCSHKKSGCEWTGELGDLDQHTTSCPKRPWKCLYCKFQSTHDIGADHAPQCDYHPVPCPNHCEVGTVPRCHAEKHLLDCPLQLVDCEFASAGCDMRVPRRDLAGHMTENAQHHLMTATLLNLRLTRELSQKMEEKDQQIAELKEELKAKIDTNRQEQTQDLHAKLQQQTGYVETKLQEQTFDLNVTLQGQTQNHNATLQQQTDDLNGKLQQQTRGLDTKLREQTQKLQEGTDNLYTKLTCHSYTLTDFTANQAKGGEGSWHSECFYNFHGGYRFKLNIDTNGYDSASGTHLSAYLLLLKSNYDKHFYWPLKLEVTLDMLKQDESTGSHSVTTNIVFEKATTDSNQYKCIGTERFFPLAKLKEKHYLRNNMLLLRLRLKVIS